MNKVNLEQFEAFFCELVAESLPFNKLIGMRLESLDIDNPKIRIDMRNDLIGNPFSGILHGGVITAALDMIGGLAIMVTYTAEHHDLSSLRKLSTINLHVDFLRPGKGAFFIASGHIVRRGNRIAVVRTEFANERQELIATGVAAYNLG